MAEFEHNEHKVTLTSGFMFAVTGPAFDRPEEYESAAKAIEAIDRRMKARERQQQARARISIEAVDDTGAPCTIRGINANTSHLLGVPDGRNGPRDVFPPVPWLVAKIKRWRELQREVLRFRDEIDEYRVMARRGYGRLNAEEYDQKLKFFEEEFERKSAAAKANDPGAESIA